MVDLNPAPSEVRPDNREEYNANSEVRSGDREEHNATVERPNQDITISCESEYKDYNYNEKVDIWTLVSLKAPRQIEEENEEKRAPIDLVAVIDKSGSMSGEKLELVKKTLEFVLTQLNEKDRLSVVSYDTDVNLEFGLQNIDKKGKDFALKMIKSIQSGSSTNLSGGLMKGLCQMIDRKKKNEVASVLLFTDGLANHGITNVDGIVAAMKDPKRFDGVSRNGNQNNRGPRLQQQQRPQRHQSWLRNVFGGGNKKTNINFEQQQAPEEYDDVEEDEANNTEEGSSRKTTDATVYTFGFGTDHNPAMLTKISEAGNGMYYYIENEDKIAESFAHCLGGLMSTAAQGIQLQISLEDGVHIKEVHTVRPFEKSGNNKSIKIDIGDLQAEEKRDVVLELTLDSVPQPYSTTPQQVLKAQVDYFNVFISQLGTGETTLAVLRPETAEPRGGENVHREVGKQKARVRVTGVMRKATAAADAGDFENARQQMLGEISFIREMENALPDDEDNDEDRDFYVAMTKDLECCTDNIGTRTAYSSKGAKMQMNMVQQYEVQRSSNIDSEAFASNRVYRMKKQKAAKSFFGKKE